MNNTFVLVALVVVVSLMIFGLIMLPILKKFKAGDTAINITVLSTCFCGLLAAGALVYLVSVNMMKEYVEIKRYSTYTLTNSDGSRSLTVKEYSDDKTSGFELYLDGNEKKLADVRTDSFLPFSSGQFKTEWGGDSVRILYTFRNNDDQYICSSCTVSYDGSFTQGDNEDIDLREKEEPQSSFDYENPTPM